VVGGVLVFLFTSALAGVAGSFMSTRLLRAENENLRKMLASIVSELKAIREDLADLQHENETLRTERTSCELRAGKSYAGRDELVRTMVDTAAAHRELMARLDSMGSSLRESIGKVHARVDDVHGRLSHLEGKVHA
jgi:phage shock protein A